MSTYSEKIINKYKNDMGLNYIAYYQDNDYFYGWFEDDKSSTADGVILARINKKTEKIEECNVLIAPLRWNIDYKEFTDIDNSK